MKKYNIGVISMLKDIEYIKKNNRYFENFKYYYTGFFIYDNPKMSYK